MTDTKCPNCGKDKKRLQKLCEKCQQEARQLDRNLSDDLGVEDRPQYLRKNEEKRRRW